MKKIFTLFAALACVMSMSAKVIYLKPNSNWQQANATFWVHAWGAGDKDVKMTPVEGDPTVYQAEVGESTSVIFMRRDPSKDASNVWDLWNRMGNLAIPADKNCCAINEGEWTQEKEDASAHVTWSVYTPSTGGEDPDPGTGGDEPKPEVGYYITGNSELVGGDGWKANEIQMLENEGTYTHTFEQLQAGVEYKMKVTDGSWTKHWGYTALQIVPEGVVKDGDGNIVFKMAEVSDLAVAFDGTNITLTGTFAEIELPTVVYNVTVPEGTKACYIAGAMNGWSQEEMTKVDDTHYTISIKGATTEMKYKYCSGPSWDYVEMQADGVTDVQDRTYSENDVVEAWKAVYAPGEEPGEEPGEDPEPSTGVTYNVTVPAGTNACYIAGEMNNWSHIEMTKIDDTHYTLTVADATTAMKYKYCSGPSWDYVEMRADGVTDVQDRTYSANDVVEAWKAVYAPGEEPGEEPGEDPEPSTGVTYNVTVPVGTNACYIAGEMNAWSHTEMTKVDDTHYTLTVADATTAMKYKYCSGPSWDYVEMRADGVTDVQDRTYSENDVVEAWKAVYAPGEEPGEDPIDPNPGETKDITVKAKVPAEWTDVITVWVWATGLEGQEAIPTQEGEWYVYTHTGTELNIIFKNGAGWNGDTNQTVDMYFTESACVEIIAGEGKATYELVDCDSNTAVENVDATNKNVKFVYNGQLVVRHNDKLYNVMGQEVK